ncbi:MAG: hypothetical protein HY696_02400 [Deltaproteobacteria bacterium]|nr:hypothetical protein [Deltaproteobacteria bacterium]
MNTTPIQKHAVIINGDTEGRHLENVERSIRTLKAQGYTVHVASPQRPTTPLGPDDHYAKADLKGIKTLLTGARAQLDDNDELVIYTTGHGDQKKETGSLCLTTGCKTPGVDQFLDELPYGQRVVVMDQCYSGNWSHRFADDPRTLFIAAGSKGETVCCQDFAPHFWSSKVPDLNRDGTASWQERYAYAIAQGKTKASFPQFVRSAGFLDAGRPTFPTTVGDIKTAAELRAALKKLQPGQYAAVLFSADWCGPCKTFAPAFAAQAKALGGQVRFLRTENEALAKQYGATVFPTVMFVDGEGNRYLVPPNEHDQFTEHLGKFHVPTAQRLAAFRAKITDRSISEWEAAGHTYVGLAKTLPPDQLIAEIEALRTAFLSAPHRDGFYIAESVYGQLVAALPKPALARELAVARELLAVCVWNPQMADVADHLYRMAVKYTDPTPAMAAREATALRELLVRSGGAATVGREYAATVLALTTNAQRSEEQAVRALLADPPARTTAALLQAYRGVVRANDTGLRDTWRRNETMAARIATFTQDADARVAEAAAELVPDFAAAIAKDPARANRAAQGLRTRAMLPDSAGVITNLKAYAALTTTGVLTAQEATAGGRWSLQLLSRTTNRYDTGPAILQVIAAAQVVAALAPQLPMELAHEAVVSLLARAELGVQGIDYQAQQGLARLLPLFDASTRQGHLRKLLTRLDPQSDAPVHARSSLKDLFEVFCRQALGCGPSIATERVWVKGLRSPDPLLRRGTLYALHSGIFGDPSEQAAQVAAVEALTTSSDPQWHALAAAVLAKHRATRR